MAALTSRFPGAEHGSFGSFRRRQSDLAMANGRGFILAASLSGLLWVGLLNLL